MRPGCRQGRGYHKTSGPAREPAARNGAEEHERPVRCYPPSAHHWSNRVDATGAQPNGVRLVLPLHRGGCPMTAPQTATCPQCSRMISPEDTIVFGRGRLGHLDCRRPRVLSAEERTLAFLYCRDHEVAECPTCTRRFRLLELVSQNQFGVRLHACPWCHTDLTDAIRAHLYGCGMLPAEVRRRAQEARDAARQLVKQSQQLRDNADVLIREAEASLHALRATLRRPLARSATSETKHSERQIRFVSYHVLPGHLQVGDRFSDETGEWEVTSQPHSIAGSESVNASVRRVDQPSTPEDRTWVAHERIRVRAPHRSLSA